MSRGVLKAQNGKRFAGGKISKSEKFSALKKSEKKPKNIEKPYEYLPYVEYSYVAMAFEEIEEICETFQRTKCKSGKFFIRPNCVYAS